MSAGEFALLLFLLGGASALAAFLGHRGGDSRSDVGLMLAVAGVLGTAAAVLRVA